MSKDRLPQLPYEVYSGVPPKRNLRDRIRGAFFDGMVTIDLTFCSFLAYDLDKRNPATPDFLQGRIVDIIGTAANIALLKTIYGVWDPAPDLRESTKGTRLENIANKLAENRPLLSALSGFLAQANWEVMQGLGIIPGTYDPGDFIAYGVGALGFVGLNYGAKYLEKRFGNSLIDNMNELSRLPSQVLSRVRTSINS